MPGFRVRSAPTVPLLLTIERSVTHSDTLIKPCSSFSNTLRAGALVGAAVLGLSCTSTGVPVQGSSDVIGVQMTQLSVVVENKVGMPLTDVNVAVVPVGRATEFTKFIGRMENGEKRDLSLGDFFGRDGTPLSLRVVRPKSVRITAKDLTNNPYTVEVPWK